MKTTCSFPSENLIFCCKELHFSYQSVTNSRHCNQSSAALLTVRVRGGEAVLVCEAVGTLAAVVAEQGASSGAAAIANGDPTGALAVAAAGDDSEIVFNGFFKLAFE
jgi:hypothetical protein